MATTAVKAKAPATRTSDMQSFVWEGTDKRGVKMKGESTSKNANLLRAELRKQGINPTIVKTKSKPLFGAAGKPVKPAEIAVFSRQIATMLQSGVPMVQSFEILASGQKNPRMTDMLTDIRDNIAGGSSLSEAMERHPVQFDLLYRNLTRAGEQAGVLDTVLDTVATYKERTEALKGKIKKALFYPAAVIAVAILVSAILLIYVVLVWLFKSLIQPLILLVSIPFAATGTILALWLTGTPLGLPSLVGMLMLIGIVVTNAIVLIDLVNQYRRHGMALDDALLRGGQNRVRPIIMTAAATIMAMIPPALGLSGQSSFVSAPMAVAVIGGLVASTLITLVIVPVLYRMIEGLKERRGHDPAAVEGAPVTDDTTPRRALDPGVTTSV